MHSRETLLHRIRLSCAPRRALAEAHGWTVEEDETKPRLYKPLLRLHKPLPFFPPNITAVKIQFSLPSAMESPSRRFASFVCIVVVTIRFFFLLLNLSGFFWFLIFSLLEKQTPCCLIFYFDFNYCSECLGFLFLFVNQSFV